MPEMFEKTPLTAEAKHVVLNLFETACLLLCLPFARMTGRLHKLLLAY
jgi:hypothetical protein